MKLKQKLERLSMPGAATSAPPSAPIVSEATPASGSEAAHTAEIGERKARIANLRAQLAALQLEKRVAPPPRTPRSDWIDDDLPTSRARTFLDARGDLPGECVETPLGQLRRVITLHEEDHRHGASAVAPARVVQPEDVALLSLDAAMRAVDFTRALYLDTETTGLAGGAGTLPFLIGMAWFEGPCLQVEQLLLSGPGHERPMLARLAERLREASVIVSYNGKSFDWPLLRTRFILNRFAAPTLPAHLDLLHCARRVYKSRLGSVRLVALEEALLGFERIDDIPGELIPETYFAFVRGHAAGAALVPVVDHNRSDLVALPALLGEIVRRFSVDHAGQDARDQLGFAKVAARGEASERAIALAHGAARADVRGELAPSALYLVGALKLRRGDYDGAAEAFASSLDASVDLADVGRARLALAKLHEHKTKRYDLALEHAQHTAACEGDAASTRRVVRLTERLARRVRVDALS